MAKKSSARKGLRTADVCKELDIQPYVLRYWEGEFQALAGGGKSGAQRTYSPEEMLVLRRIRELLYDEGYTIAGAKKKLDAEIESGALSESEQDSESTATAAGSETASSDLPADRPAEEEESSRDVAASEEDAAPEPTLFDETSSLAADVSTTELDSASRERIEKLARGLRALHEDASELLESLRSR